MTYPFMTGVAKSDFGKKVAETVREVAKHVDAATQDNSLREQVKADLEKLAKRHEET